MAAGFRSPSPPPPRLLPILFLVLDCLLLVLFSVVPSGSEYNCTNFEPEECGNFSISYPFWKSSDYSDHPLFDYCGHQAFEVTCWAESTPLLRLGDYNYTVLKIDDKAAVISLAYPEIPGSNYCSGFLHNVTLPSYVSFSYENVDITFFFHCPEAPDDSEWRNNSISCPGVGKNYVFGEKPKYGPENCGEMLVLPVLRSSLTDPNRLLHEYAAALLGGFELNWSNDDDIFCANCDKTSEGRCGQHDHGSACFYSNGTVVSQSEQRSLVGGQRNHHRKALIIGIVTGALVAVGLLCAGILFYRYKKKRDYSASMKSFIRSASSGPSSRDPEKYSVHFQAYIFSYDELQEATNGFDNELGDGGFGRVYKGKLPDGRVVAVKRLYENNYRRLEQFMNEIEILSRVRHQNLVDLYGWTSRDSKELLLVYEFVPNGTVADHLHGSRAREGILTLPMRLNIAVETAEALAYLHAIDPPIIHRDVKTSNILLDSSFHVKVADFGLSRLFPFNATHVSTAPQGTPGYLDPEYHQCYQLTNKSDVYSFGVVLVELLSSKPAVDITRHRKEINLANWALNRIQNGELDQLADESLGYQSDQAARQIVTMVSEVAFRCLQVDGDMRPSMKEVLEALLAIQREVDKVSKGGKEPGDNEDDAGLLKNVVPMSPNTVMNQWVSNSTTPNTSND